MHVFSLDQIDSLRTRTVWDFLAERNPLFFAKIFGGKLYVYHLADGTSEARHSQRSDMTEVIIGGIMILPHCFSDAEPRILITYQPQGHTWSHMAWGARAISAHFTRKDLALVDRLDRKEWVQGIGRGLEAAAVLQNASRASSPRLRIVK